MSLSVRESDGSPAHASAHAPGAAASIRARLEAAGRANLAALPRPAPAAAPRVTAVLVSWNRPEGIRRALASLRTSASIPYRVLVVDNGSSAATRQVLAEEVATDPAVALALLDRNIGAAGGRQHGADLVQTEFVLFLDDDAEVFPGTVEHLVDALDRDPAALAAAAHVVLPDGSVQLCGGDFTVEHGLVRFIQMDAGLPFETLAQAPAEPCRWVGGAGQMYRRSALARFPLETGMATYFEDNEWGYRAERAEPGSQRRVPRALVLHDHVPKERRGSSPNDVIHAVRFAEPVAFFYRRHGVVMEALFGFVPELVRPSGPDVAAARIFCELLADRGVEWIVTQWLNGGLSPLFEPTEPVRLPPPPPPTEAPVADAVHEELRRIRGSKWWRLATAYWTARFAIRRAVGLTSKSR